MVGFLWLQYERSGRRREEGRARFVNTASIAGVIGVATWANYVAAKHGAVGLTKVAALELGPHGIRVNCVAPGAIGTDRTRAETSDYAGQWSPLTPLRRVGTVEDVAAAVVWLAGPESSFVSGQTLLVDGGVFSQAVWPNY